jgi:hypothetical protein
MQPDKPEAFDMQENLITLTQAAKLLPSNNGKRIAVSTLFRWATRGLRGVRLESRRFGRRIYTTPEALDAFGKALIDLPPLPRDGHHQHRNRSEQQADRDLARAERELEKAGI